MGLWDWLARLFGAQRGRREEPLPPPEQGRTLADLAVQSGIAADQLRQQPIEYRRFTIPKRNGTPREILAPVDSLKALQRRLLRRVLGGLPVHPAAMGFERGRSIVTHARCHIGQAVVIHMDIRDFFPSTRAERVERYFRFAGWNAEAAAALTRLCTFEGALPQGAPTSPKLSNLVNQRLDARLTALTMTVPRFVNPGTLRSVPADNAHGWYTRYADDLTFSFPVCSAVRANWIIHVTKAVLRDEGYQLHIHRKLRIMRRHHRQMVTGLVVNDRVNLARRRRRLLRAVEHHLRTGRTATLGDQQLAGWRAFQQMVDRAPPA